MLKVLGKDFLIYGVSSSIGKFVALFLVPIYTSIFSPGDYGIIDIVSTVVSICTILGMVQLESAVSRYYFAEKDEYYRNKMVSTALWSVLGLSLLFLLILFVFSDFISLQLFDSAKYAKIILLASVAIPLNNLSSLFTVVVRFKKKAAHYLLFQIIQIGVSVTVTIVLVVYLRVGIMGVFCGQISGTLIAVLLMLIYLRRELFFTWSASELKKMMSFSLPLVPAVAGSWANSYVSRFVMVGYLSLTEIGLYAVSLKIASFFQLIATALRMAWGPFMWETYEDNPNHRQIFIKIQNAFSIFVLTVVVLIALFAKEIIFLFTTKEYINAANLIGIMCLSSAINGVIMQLTCIGPGISKKTQYNTIVYFFGLVVNILSLFLFVPLFGLVGVALSLLLGNIASLIVGWYISERLYYIGFDKIKMSVNLFIAVVLIVITVLFDINIYVKVFIAFGFFAIVSKTYWHLIQDIINKAKIKFKA